MRFWTFLLLLGFLFVSQSAHAFWMWTPESGKWVNPKYSVKETPSLQLDYALTFINAKDYKSALVELRKLIKYYPKSRQSSEAQFYIGECLEAQDKLFEAYKEYQIVIDKYPFSDRAADIVQKQFAIGEKMLDGASNRSKLVDAVSGTDYNVIEVFRSVIKNAPYGNLAPLAQYKIGLYLMAKQLYQEARDEFEKVINDYPSSEWAKAAKFQIASTDAKRSTDPAYDQKTTKSAVDEFKEFVAANPDAELSEQAKKNIMSLREKEAENNFLIAQYYEKQKNYASAKIYYQNIVRQYNNTTWVNKALERIRLLGEKNK